MTEIDIKKKKAKTSRLEEKPTKRPKMMNRPKIG